MLGTSLEVFFVIVIAHASIIIFHVVLNGGTVQKWTEMARLHMRSNVRA
jgi:hypothetical protein